jgi:hypothetical protein
VGRRRKLAGTGAVLDRRAYEIAVIMTLRVRLRSGDIWVEGSRGFRAFDDVLVPPETFAARQQKVELGLAVSDRFDEWRAERAGLLEAKLKKIDTLASTGQLAEAVITAERGSCPPRSEDDCLDVLGAGVGADLQGDGDRISDSLQIKAVRRDREPVGFLDGTGD